MSIVKNRLTNPKTAQAVEKESVLNWTVSKAKCETYLTRFILIRFVMVLLLAAVSSEAMATARPIYLFSHRANDIDDISTSINNGGNAIEIDLQFCGSSGWKVNHNHCSGPVTLESWLHGFSDIERKRQIAALKFDIKADRAEANADAIKNLVRSVRASLGTDLLIIYSVGAWNKRQLLEHIMLNLKNNEAVNIDSSSGRSAQQKINFFKKNGVNNTFYADGSSSLVDRSSWFNIRHARDNRDTQNDVKMVYSWTLTKKLSITKMLIQERLDGLLVNDPSIYSYGRAINGMSNALEVVAENAATIRLATRDDLQRLNLMNNSSEPILLSEDYTESESVKTIVSKSGSN